MNSDDLLRARMASLDAKGWLRSRYDDSRGRAGRAAEKLGRALLDLSSNDYLGFASQPLNTALPTAGGSGASRLIHGTRPAHQQAEAALARWLGTADALLFASGYAANVGVVSALAQPSEVVLSDTLNHASLIDGCRLSGAEIRKFPHRDLDQLARSLGGLAETTTAWVLTETYFSMDGTVPNLALLGEICRARPNTHLIVDEAHALGVFGPRGAGLCAEAGVAPAAIVGTFGKALGLHGAFAAGSTELCDWLWNRARSFVYSTAPSPALVAAVPARVAELAEAEQARCHLSLLCQTFHVKLRSVLPKHYPADVAVGPVIPLLIGSEHSALAARDALTERGILTQAIRPPTVPKGSSRLRLSLHAGLTATDLEYALEQLHAALTALPNS